MLGEGGSCAREGGSSAGEGGSSSWGGPRPLVFNFLALKKPVTPNNINNRSAFALSVIYKDSDFWRSSPKRYILENYM